MSSTFSEIGYPVTLQYEGADNEESAWKSMFKRDWSIAGPEEGLPGPCAHLPARGATRSGYGSSCRQTDMTIGAWGPLLTHV